MNPITANGDKCTTCGKPALLSLVSTETGMPFAVCPGHFDQRLRENIAAGSSEHSWKERTRQPQR